MALQALKEVSAPYLVNPDDEAVGRETILIRRNGEPIAALVPYAEYQQLTAEKASPPPMVTALPVNPDFLKQWEAFQRLQPELLKDHLGQWVAIVNERVVEVGPDFGTVADRATARFKDAPMCIGEVLEKPRIYRLPHRRVTRHES